MFQHDMFFSQGLTANQPVFHRVLSQRGQLLPLEGSGLVHWCLSPFPEVPGLRENRWILVAQSCTCSNFSFVGLGCLENFKDFISTSLHAQQFVYNSKPSSYRYRAIQTYPFVPACGHLTPQTESNGHLAVLSNSETHFRICTTKAPMIPLPEPTLLKVGMTCTHH